jgi:hypothetical protein
MLVLLLAAAASAAQQPAMPEFAVVTTAVEGFIATLEDYQAGDLVTQSQIAQALDKVRDAGWNVPEPDRIVQLALADDSFLARELSTPAGWKFMRRIARHQGAYARLDRLCSISRGETIVHDLVRQRDGHKLIEYLATTKGGRNLGGMLAGARHGQDLNKPTGRIYTADDLIAELERVYDEAKSRN